MRVLPRSDKFYVGLIVTFSAVVIIFSIVAAVAAFSGDRKPSPAYQSAPDPSLVQLPPETLLNNPDKEADVQNQVSAPPMDDQVYLQLHSTTRQILQALTNPNKRIAQVQLARLGLGRQGSYDLLKKFKQTQSGWIANTHMQATDKPSVTVGDLQFSRAGAGGGRNLLYSDVTASQDFVLMYNNKDNLCHASEPFSLRLDVRWSLILDQKGDALGGWRMEQPQLDPRTPQAASAC